MNIEETKKNLLKTMESIDKDKLSLMELKSYAETLKVISEIQAKTYAEMFAESMSNVSMGFSGPKAPTVAEMK